MELDQASTLRAALDGRYTVERELGAGGMATVYVATDLKHNRRVAIKVMRPEVSHALGSTRFLREIAVAAQLRHPNIVPLFDSGDANGLLYFVMPLVDGESLRARLKRERQLPIDEALRIAGEVADALKYAHERGIIHRDIKPENILLESGHAMLTDFGIARVSSGSGERKLTDTGLVIGTPAYMSPEQAVGDSTIDARSDEYALGTVLYEMLIGEPPFTGPNAQAVLARMLKEPVPDMRTVRETIPPGLEGVVDRALARAPADRYATIGELQAALRSPAASAPPRRRSRKRTAAFVSLGVLALAGMGAAVGMSANPSVPFEKRDWVLLADFENKTGDSLLDRGLGSALRVGLEQSRHVNVFPRTRVAEALAYMQRPDSGALGEALAREVALRQNIRVVAVASIERVGETFMLTTRLVDPATGEDLKARSVRAKDRGQVLGALDELTRDLRRDLGEPIFSVARRGVRLDQATTSSLQALSSWSEGNRLFSAEHYREAGEMYLHATELDPNFAMAYHSLGQFYYFVQNRKAGDVAFDRALTLSSKVTERDRLLIEADVLNWREKREEAVAAYRRYLLRYPDDPTAWYQMGYAFLRLKRSAESIDAFQHVLAIDSLRAGAWVNIATVYGGDGRFRDAIAAYQRAFAIKPSVQLGIMTNHEIGFTFVKAGDVPGAEDNFRRMLSQSPAQRGRGNRSLALLRMYQGQYREAVPFLMASLEYDRSQSPQGRLSETRDLLFLASVYGLLGDSTRVRRALADADSISKLEPLDPGILQYLGKLQARAGQTRAAEATLDRLNKGARADNKIDKAAQSLLGGEIALSRGRKPDAVKQLELSVTLSTNSYSLESLAHALLITGDTAGARARYQEIMQRTTDLGWEAQEYFLLARLQLGRIYQAQGQNDLAAEQYAHLVEIWSAGDADLPPLVEARARLKQVKGN
jgi:serine/threonine-protein kinase